MKTAIVVAIVLIVGVVAWSVANGLKADGTGVSVALGFGVLAGIPATLLVFVSSRPRAPWESEEEE